MKSVWIFDSNYRVYEEDKSAPVYRHHWREYEVVSETSRSYVLSNGRKVPKLIPKTVYGIEFSIEAVELDIWLHDNKPKIINKLQVSKDVELFKKIDGLLK